MSRLPLTTLLSAASSPISAQVLAAVEERAAVEDRCHPRPFGNDCSAVCCDVCRRCTDLRWEEHP